MKIERKTIRDFMQNVMREKLFASPVYTRTELCSLFEHYTGRPLNFDDKLELIRTLKSIELPREDWNSYYLVEDTAEKMYMSQNIYNVVNFFADPVNSNSWEQYMNSIYQEGEANTQSMPEDTITDIDTFILTIVNAPTDEAVAELCNKATPEVLRNCVKGIIRNGTSNVRDFLNLIARMRNMQKEYFKTRNPQVLAECKILEGKVDKELERMTLALAGRGKQEAQA